MFIVLEGPDGVGKTTQALKLLSRINEHSKRKAHVLREPGGTEIGSKIRQLLLDPSSIMLPETEAMLFMASRCELHGKINKLLDDGDHVIMDRWAYSSYAYQQCMNYGAWVNFTNFVCRMRYPDVSILLNVPMDLALGRSARVDRIETRSEDYFDQVRFRYNTLVDTGHLTRIDGTRTVDEVHAKIWDIVKPRL